MDHYEDFTWIEHIKVCSNPETDRWELYASAANKDYFLGNCSTKEQAIDCAVNAAINIICKVIPILVEGEIRNPIMDNTCRARECKWNANDSCMNVPRDVTLPLPEADYSIEAWTEEGNVVPRLCPQYEKVEI